MSVNIVNKETGELLLVAGYGNGSAPVWKGTRAEHDSAATSGTLPNEAIIGITDEDFSLTGNSIQVSSLPTASENELGKIYQYVGTTSGVYTNGWFYKCVSDGALIPTYTWAVILQPSNASTKADLADLAPTFSDLSDYVVGQYVIYDGDMYRCTTIHQAGEWNSGHFVKVNVGAELTSIASSGTSSTAAVIDDTTKTSARTWSSQKISNEIVNGTPVMQGATAYADGAKGFVPKPESTDNQKFLCGDGKYHTVYTQAAGSTIVVQTAESELYGRTVTLTLGTTTRTATISNSGEAVFTDVSYYGTAVVSADDGNGNEARGSVNLTYFGNYVVGLGFNFSTIYWETTNASLAGKQLSVYIGNREVGTVTLALVSGTSTYRATMYVETLATYKINTMTNVGRARGTAVVSALKQTITANVDTGEIYSFKIAKNDSNPATRVMPYTDCEYGCDNAAFTAAHMDFTNDVFNYGSWTRQEFFWPKPCMLRYDGVVDYYLNPDNYSLRADGVTASDVADMSYPGNVMVEFPTIYFKRWEDSDYHYCVISDKQLDITFHAWAHHDVDGDILPYIYLSAYDGSYDGTRMRSISGCGYNATLASGNVICQTTPQQGINFAQANNDVGEQGEGWYIRHKADWDMINDLLILIGMSTDTQTTFGLVICNRGNHGCIGTGTMDNKGLFWGSNDGTSGVKVFGIENWWANISRTIAGWINANGTQKVKMTYEQEDGSATDGFNLDGTGYVAISNSTPTGTGTEGGYINTYYATEYGMIPKNANGSATTYLCDGMWYNNSQINFVIVGGHSNDGDVCGAFNVGLNVWTMGTYWGTGAALSYKGIVQST